MNTVPVRVVEGPGLSTLEILVGVSGLLATLAAVGALWVALRAAKHSEASARSSGKAAESARYTAEKTREIAANLERTAELLVAAEAAATARRLATIRPRLAIHIPPQTGPGLEISLTNAGGAASRALICAVRGTQLSSTG